MQEKVLKINGMMCTGCENRVKNILKDIDNIKEVEANYKTKEVKIKYQNDIDLNEIKTAITDNGYEIVEE